MKSKNIIPVILVITSIILFIVALILFLNTNYINNGNKNDEKENGVNKQEEVEINKQEIQNDKETEVNDGKNNTVNKDEKEINDKVNTKDLILVNEIKCEKPQTKQIVEMLKMLNTKNKTLICAGVTESTSPIR